MPVTLNLTDHCTTPKVLQPGVSPSQILERACLGQRKEAGKILHCSIGQTERQDIRFRIIPNEHGVVDTMLSAYTGNYALVLRPDDVWLAVISQFSLFANANPKLLRDEANFVSHEPGKGQPLEIVDFNSLPLSAQIGELMQQNVLDPALRDWVLPKFSTSTSDDIAVGSMLWMAPTVKKVFISDTETLRRGIPRVTLEGISQDWASLLKKLERLKKYGILAIAWYHLLYPVGSMLAKSFDDPNSPENIEFWKKVVHGEGFGGRSLKLSGWITAFCVFSFEGEWRGPDLRTSRVGKKDPATLPAFHFWSTYAPSLQETSLDMTIDGTKYPVLTIHDLPAGCAEVDITVNRGGIASPCVVVAGLTGVGFSSSRDHSLSGSGRNDTVRPVVAWWIFSMLPEAQPQPREDEPKIIISPEPTMGLPGSGDGVSPTRDGNPVPIF
ncbi:hypothetical protein C8F04DRAFT_1050099 [Mycena alexandri]|uniref:Uncharacterized protein n=1 Tax=Mycena alexandri TaxID=1745969 RepID=A0AAD6S5C6_9AGAR|nr:hypothetical protein C8F04DRAFT_1050099 [Mycena alexandri]